MHILTLCNITECFFLDRNMSSSPKMSEPKLTDWISERRNLPWLPFRIFWRTWNFNQLPLSPWKCSFRIHYLKSPPIPFLCFTPHPAFVPTRLHDTDKGPKLSTWRAWIPQYLALLLPRPAYLNLVNLMVQCTVVMAMKKKTQKIPLWSWKWKETLRGNILNYFESK